MLPTLAAAVLAAVVAADPAASDRTYGAVAGTVTLTDAQGKPFDAPGVQLTLVCPGMPRDTQTSASDEHGAFRFPSVRAEHCSVSTDLQGFEATTADFVVRAGETTEVELHLDVTPVDVGVHVVAGSTSSSHKRRSK